MSRIHNTALKYVYFVWAFYIYPCFFLSAGYKRTNKVSGGLGQNGKEAARRGWKRNVDPCRQIEVDFCLLLDFLYNTRYSALELPGTDSSGWKFFLFYKTGFLGFIRIFFTVPTVDLCRQIKVDFFHLFYMSAPFSGWFLPPNLVVSFTYLSFLELITTYYR